MAPKRAAPRRTTRLNPGATSDPNQAPSTTTTTITNAQLQAMIDQGVTAALAARDANRTGDDSHTSGTGVRRTERVTRECTYQDFMKCQPLYFKGTKGVIELTQWFERMETVFRISNCLAENQTKFATCTLLAGALTWWNSHVRIVGSDAAYVMTWIELKKKMANKVERYIGGLPDSIHGSVAASKPKTMQEATEMATGLMDKKIRTYAERQAANKRKFEDTSRNNQSRQQPPKRQDVARAYAAGSDNRQQYAGSRPLYPKCNFNHDGPCIPRCYKYNKIGHLARDCRSPTNANVANNQRGNGAGQKATCYECGAQGHFKRNWPKRKNNNNNRGNQVGTGNAQARVLTFQLPLGFCLRMADCFIEMSPFVCMACSTSHFLKSRDFKVLSNFIFHAREGGVIGPHESPYTKSKCEVDLAFAFFGNGALLEIMNHEVKWLRNSRVPIVKVRWNSRRGPEFTWEREDQFKKKVTRLLTHILLRAILEVLQIGINSQDTIMSDSEDSMVTDTTVSSPYEGRSGDVSPRVDGPPELEQAPPSPVYIHYVTEPEYPGYIPPDDEVFPAEEQPLPAAASPTTYSPRYIPESDPDEDPEDFDDEDPANYPVDHDDEEEEEEPSGDDVDEDYEEQDEDDDDEEEEHPASADSIPPPPALCVTTRIFSRPQPPLLSFTKEDAKRFLAMPIPPPSPLTPLSSPLPQIPSSSLPASPPILLIPLPAASLPLQLLSSGHRADRPEVTLPPRKRMTNVHCPRCEAGESLVVAVARPMETHRADYGFVGSVEAEIR
nr:hypothetical protein [Tanacetum cinerariifolium]